VLAGIVAVLVILVNLTPVQNFLAQKAVDYLSGRLGTRVALKHVRLDLFNQATLEGLYIEDRQHDTLLYAGEARVKITDWFFLKDKPVISYIGLKNAYANLHRSRGSDQWNYQFVVDAFATGPKKNESGKKGTINLDLRELELEQIRFHMIDEWTGSDMIGELAAFEMHARKFDFGQKIIDIRSVKGDKVVFGLRDYKGGRPPRPKSVLAAPVADTTPFNPGRWKVDLEELALKDARFFLEDPDTRAVPGYFDPMHMDVKGIDLEAGHIVIRGDTLKGTLELLKGKERCGLEIRKMSAKVTVSPVLSECKDLVLQTANSNLGNYYAMHYRRFPDFEEYITNVVMVARLQQSEVGIEDIAYFAPAMDRFRNVSVRVSGQSKGTVARFKVDNLVLDDGLTRLGGNLAMNGLPDIDKTLIDFQEGTVRTNGAAAFLYVPELKKQEAIDLGALSHVEIKGSFTGLISDFTARAAIASNLGAVRADIRMQLPAHAASAYSGTLATDQFDAGRLFRLDFMGKNTLDVTIEGKGFDAATAAIDVKGNIAAAELNGYNYRNVNVDGVLAAKKFDGSLSARDPNLMMDFSGKVDFSGQEPVFDVAARVEHINAAALGFTKDSISGTADMKLDFRGSTIDNFVGSAYIYNMDIRRDSTRLNLDSLQLISRVDAEGGKQLFLSTNGLTANVSGRFSLADLPGSAQQFLSYYLPQYVSPPARVNEQQNLQFNIATENTDDLLSLFGPIRLGPGARFSGSMDMAHQQLTFTGTLPYFAYSNFRFSNIQIDSRGTYAGFELQAMVNGIRAGDNDLASSVQFQTSIFRDSAKFQLLTTTPTAIGSAELNGTAYADRDSFFVHILPSEFFLNQTRWEIPQGNEIVFAKDYLSIHNLTVRSGLQSIVVNAGDAYRSGKTRVSIRDLDITPVNALLGMETINMDGRINGTVEASSLLKDQLIRFDLAASNLRINSDTLGEARAAGTYDVARALITLDKESGLSYKDSRAALSGTYSLDPKSKENIDARISLDNANMNWAEPFLTGYVHQMTGHLSGDITISGSAADPVTTGSIHLDNVGFVPDITGVHYTIRAADISVSDTKFDLGSITVTDDDGREGILSGSIMHRRLSKMNFRLNMRSDNIKVVDLRDYQSANFYGDVKASVQLRLSGPVNNLNLNIFATPQKNSHLYIPIGYGGDVGEYDYIHFKQYGEAMPVAENNKNKLNIRIDAIATPDLEATIILDPATGDQIWAKGSGNIILEIPAAGDMRMNGNYIIDEGKYNFSFKQLQVLNYRRQFTINSNSVIKWNGDIADADLDVTAYAQIKARLYDLIINEVDRVGLSQNEIRDAQIMQMVNVQMNMRGSLKEPELSFRLDLAENRSVGTYAYQKLQRINSDDKELLNQVASLLLLEQFVPPEGISNSNAVASGTINNMSQLISSAASSQVTNFANKILGMEDLYIDLTYKNYNLAYNSQPFAIDYQNRNEAGVNLRKNFFNNRLVVEVGGVYDWGRANAQSDLTANFAGDFRVQYLLTEDGRIRFNIFRTSNYDGIALQTISRQGVGLSYRKSFNGLADLFKSEEKLRREREEELKRQSRQSMKSNNVADTSLPRISGSFKGMEP